MRAASRIQKTIHKPEVIAHQKEAVMSENKTILPVKTKKALTPTLQLSSEDIAEAQVTKRGILKTLILISLLFVLQAAIFLGKSKGMLPF